MKIITITLIAILFFSFIKCQNNCISITNCNDLLALNGSSCYQLANNIDCSSVQPFTPIFNFSGILYGNRLKIMNLNVFSDNAALFSFLPGGAAIYDLSIENSYFNGLYAAAFVSQTVSTTSSNASATMLNCYSKNNTIVSNSTASMASGLVAYVGYPLIMGGCWSTYNRIYSYTFSPSGNWSLSCYSGGLVAYVNSTFTLFECTSEYNDIRSLSSSSGSSSDASFAGGVVAFNGLTSTVIAECISTNNYIFSFSKQSFLSNQIISCSGGICAQCYGTIINSVSSLNRVKSSLDPSSLSTFMSTSGGISAFGNANSTNTVNTISRMNLLRSDSLNGTCDCFYLPGTGCSTLCSTTPNVLFV